MRKPYRVIILLFMILLLSGNTRGFAENRREKELTLIVYMCGSNLESEGASASHDLDEMENAGFDENRMNVLVMTGGAGAWHNGQQAAGTSLIQVGDRKSRFLTVPSPETSMGKAETLTWLMRFARDRYPARDYALIIWDHGAGPLGGVCLDENFAPDRLTMDELSQALEDAGLPGKLSWIGFDACLMSTVEVAAALSPWADYMIASQESEPSTGWDYSFLTALTECPERTEAFRRLIDLYTGSDPESESTLTLACTDLSRVAEVVQEMDRYFASLAGLIGPDTFIRFSALRQESVSFGKAVPGTDSSGYDLVDLLSLLSLYGEDPGAERLEEALSRAVVYHRESAGQAGGLSVYHPYHNKEKYLSGWGLEYRRMGFCTGYTDYLLRFGDQLMSGTDGSWTALGDTRQKTETGGGHLFTLRLTGEQRTIFQHAQLVILRPWDNPAAAAFSGTAGMESGQWWYSPVAFAEAEIDENGVLSARFSDRGLYVTDGEGNPLAGPLAWRLSEDGRICVEARYRELTGRENAAENADVLFVCEETEDGKLRIIRKEIYDPLTERYTARLAVQEENYSSLLFDPLAVGVPLAEHPLPGLEQWRRTDLSSEQISLSENWSFRFLDEQISGAQLFASFEITDYWQNSVMSPMISVDNPNLFLIDRGTGEFSLDPDNPDSAGTPGPDLVLTASLVADRSLLNPSLMLCLELTNEGEERLFYEVHNLEADGRISLIWYDESQGSLDDVPPGFTRKGYFRIPGTCLRGLKELKELSFLLEAKTAGGETYSAGILLNDLTYCPLGDIAPEAGPVLAAGSLDEVILELTGLTEETNGSVRADFHIVNQSETTFHSFEWDIAMDGVAGNCYAAGSVLPGTEGYCFWVFGNLTNLSGLNTRWNGQGSINLARERLLQASGVNAVRSVQLLRADGDQAVRAVSFSLTDAFTLKADAPAARTEDMLLLDQDEIRVWAERVLIGSNGAGVRLRAVSRMDRPVVLSLGDMMIQGLDASNAGEDRMILPAGGTAYHCAFLSSLNLLPRDHIVDRLGFSFHWEDRHTGRAVIRMPETVRINDKGGVYLAATDAVTTPAVPAEEKPETVLARSDSAEITAELLSLETGFHGELTGRLRLTSHMDQDFSTFYSYMTAEDTVTDAILNRVMLPAGGTQEIAFLYENAALDDDGTVQAEEVLQHGGHETISRLTFFLGTNEAGINAAMTVPMVLDEPFRLPEAKTSGDEGSRLIAEKDGVSLSVLSIGLVPNYLDSMNMTFEIVNETDEERYIALSDVKVGGRTWIAFLSGWVPARSRRTVTAHLYADNDDDMKNEIEEISMYADLRGDSLFRFPDEPLTGQEMFLIRMKMKEGLLFSRRRGTRLLPEEYEVTSEYIGEMTDDGEWW